MELYLLRHGLAVERGTRGFATDADRPLTPAGRRQLRKIVQAMKKMDLHFTLILASPYLRAKQTAEIVAAGLSLKKRLTFATELQPGRDAAELIKKISALKPKSERVLLVGHEPDLSELISLLVTGATGAGFALKKGGLAKLEAEKLRAGKCAMLAWLLTPKQMQRMT